MVTLRRPPTGPRRGPVLEPYQVILRPLITEKATHLSERHNAYTFEVNILATKTEVISQVPGFVGSGWAAVTSNGTSVTPASGLGNAVLSQVSG